MKQLLRDIIGNTLATVLDFCAGALIAAAVLHYYHIIPLWAPFIGGLICLAPDLDVMFSFLLDLASKLSEKILGPLQKEAECWSDHHRTLLHRPLLTIPVGVFIAGLAGGMPWAIITLLELTFHYSHDTTGPYGGIMVAWPLNKHYWSWVNRWEKVYGKSRREIYILAGSHRQWVATYWQQFGIISVWEVGLSAACTVGVILLDPESSFTWVLTTLVVGAWAGLIFCHVTRSKGQ